MLLIVVVGFLAISIYHTFYKPLPDYSATISVQGVNEKTEVHWDHYGVPSIYASNEPDLYYAAGYLHAQERLWQMTIFQLMAEGRFSEFLGEDLLDFDRHQRTIGIWNTSKQIEAEAPDSLLRVLSDYARGVNDYVNKNRKSLPIEFTLLDIEPITWTPTHSFAVSRLLAWNQNINWQNKLPYIYLNSIVSGSVFRELTPYYSEEFPTSLDDLETRNLTAAIFPFFETEKNLRKLLQNEGANVGSNAWALDGSKTASGRAMLGGDPHMGMSIPGFWFEMFYSSPDINISGATIPGAPFVVLGQNQNIAWTLTNSMGDDTDFYAEQLDSSDPNMYVADSLNGEATLNQIEWREEIIKVKDGDDQFIRIPHTQNGPIINRTSDEFGLLGETPVTMRWTGSEPSQELWSFYKMNRAKNLDEFEASLEGFETPVMNFVYADRENNIALFSTGRIPIRGHNPLTLAKGWDPAHQWQGSIPFDEMPRSVNPDRGFVANANNKLHTESYPYYFGTFWEPPSRMQRIVELLESNDSITVEFMQQMQGDVFSSHARTITSLLLPVLRDIQIESEFETALTYLENWDYQYTSNSTAATIFDLFFMNLSRNILLQYVDERGYLGMIHRELVPVNVVTELLTETGSSFNILSESSNRQREEILRRSMLETLEWLTENIGPEPFEWRWEAMHTITLRPPLLGDAAKDPDAPAAFKLIVNNLFNRGPFSVQGNGLTINKSEYSWDEPFEMTLGPSIRRIVDFSTPGRTLSVLPTGQSGNPLSAHYGDQTELWLNGRYRYIYQDSTFFRESDYNTMTFIPGTSR